MKPDVALEDRQHEHDVQEGDIGDEQRRAERHVRSSGAAKPPAHTPTKPDTLFSPSSPEPTRTSTRNATCAIQPATAGDPIVDRNSSCPRSSPSERYEAAGTDSGCPKPSTYP